MPEFQYNGKQLRDVFDSRIASTRIHVKARFVAPFTGGQPAKPEGVRAYVVHHLKVDPDDVEATIDRIRREELGEHVDESSKVEGAELDKRITYGIKVIRRDPMDGACFIGSWQIKAALKTAFSRLKMFVSKQGSKGDVVELGEVRAAGISDGGPKSNFQLVRLIGPDGKPFKQGKYKTIRGNVSGPGGSRSIVQDVEVAPIGTTFEFEFACKGDRFSKQDLIDVFSCIGTIGVGSTRSLEFGRFEIVELSGSMPDKKEPKQKAPKQKAAEKTNGEKTKPKTTATTDPVEDVPVAGVDQKVNPRDLRPTVRR